MPLPATDLALLLVAAPRPSIVPALREEPRPHAHRLMPEPQLSHAKRVAEVLPQLLLEFGWHNENKHSY